MKCFNCAMWRIMSSQTLRLGDGCVTGTGAFRAGPCHKAPSQPAALRLQRGHPRPFSTRHTRPHPMDVRERPWHLRKATCSRVEKKPRGGGAGWPRWPRPPVPGALLSVGNDGTSQKFLTIRQRAEPPGALRSRWEQPLMKLGAHF